MTQFCWKHKDGHSSGSGSVADVVYAVIDDYIKRNSNETAKELRSYLNIWGDKDRNNGAGRHPLTLTQDVNYKGRYFPATIRLKGGEEISISARWVDSQGIYKNKLKKFKEKMAMYDYTITP